MEAFADREIGPSWTYLVNTMASGDSEWFCAADVPVAARIVLS